MSKSSNNSQNGVDLSTLSFAPAWAKDEKKKDYSKHEPKERSDRPRKGKGRPHNNNNRRDNNTPQRDRGRRDNFVPRPRFQPAEAPEGFTGEIMPIEDGLDRLAKQIIQTSRTYSVFELARLVLQSRERFNVGLRAPKNTKVFRNTISFATFLTKEEALQEFWSSEAKAQFYKEIQKEVEAPSGNFTSVARCSKSGVFLGPPNHHAYQTKLRELHRERFSTLPMEVFQRQIEILKSEEDINAWIESEKTQTYYLPLSDKPEVRTNPCTEEKAPPAEAEPNEENTSETAETSSPDASNEENAKECELDHSLLLKTRSDLERHFLDNHFDQVFKQVQISWVPSSIPGKMLSPGLLTLLKNTVSEERRYPGKLASLMCRQLSGRNVAVFKVKKKLKAGPSRPHTLPDIASLSERPKKLLQWALDNDGKGVDDLWKTLLPEDVSEEVKAEWFQDFKWLLSQGFVILEENGTVFYSKKEEPKPAPPKKEDKEQEAPKAEATTDPSPEESTQEIKVESPNV